MIWLSVPLWIKILNIFFALIDIALIALFFYKAYEILSDSKAEQILKGLIIFAIIYFFTIILRLSTCKWILDQIGSVMVIALIVLFQPELRQILTTFGQQEFRKLIKKDEKDLEEILLTAQQCSILQIGALIIFERKTGLKEFISSGTLLNAKISAPLLLSIFKVGTPLHDGAVIIKNDKIVAAACYLPLTSSTQIDRNLGTRHRAAVGITEEGRDCISLVVSEETGKISLAYEGKIYTNYDIDTLRIELQKLLGYTKEDNGESNE